MSHSGWSAAVPWRLKVNVLRLVLERCESSSAAAVDWFSIASSESPSQSGGCCDWPDSIVVAGRLIARRSCDGTQRGASCCSPPLHDCRAVASLESSALGGRSNEVPRSPIFVGGALGARKSNAEMLCQRVRTRSWQPKQQKFVAMGLLFNRFKRSFIPYAIANYQ